MPSLVVPFEGGQRLTWPTLSLLARTPRLLLIWRETDDKIFGPVKPLFKSRN